MLPPPLARLKGHLTAALTLLALAAPPRAARAEHGGPWIVITPQAEALPINEQIALISFNGCHDYIDPAFLRDAQPALVSDQDRAPLRLTHQHCDEDGYGRGVALFAPSKPLLLNVTYRLELLDAPPWDAPNAARPRVTLRSWRTAPAAALA
ncbi:hypothetical protein KJ940_03430, partial [Myxococcota bacterium]|nr:hypothetical protein [Myxococcota bacterium]